MNQEFDDPDDPRLVGLFTGFVVDNADPRGLGRVRILIPGVLEPASNWAFPFGVQGGGAKSRGAYDPPDVGAHVAVLFNQGDPEHPYYAPAAWGEPDGVSEIPSSPASADVPVEDKPKVKCYETAKFIVTIDDRTDHETLELRHKSSGDRVVIDGDAPGILIHGSAGVVIESDGLIALRGLKVQVNDRAILDGNKPI